MYRAAWSHTSQDSGSCPQWARELDWTEPDYQAMEESSLLGQIMFPKCYFDMYHQLSIVDHIHPFVETVYPDGCDLFQQDNAPSHKSEMSQEWFEVLIGLRIPQISAQYLYVFI